MSEHFPWAKISSKMLEWKSGFWWPCLLAYIFGICTLLQFLSILPLLVGQIGLKITIILRFVMKS